MLLLLLLVYLIGVYLTQLVTNQRKSEECVGRCHKELTKYFGSLSRALLVLYQVITGGIDWSEVLEPLMDFVSPILAIVFCMYIAFVVFALMNVVTGVFVESALQSTKHDQDVVLLHQIRHLLKVIDADRSGTISWEEFEGELYSPAMVRLFKTIDLDPEEARDLFRLIDIDGSGEISSEEFINGCLRLRGPAKAIDMAAFMFDYKRSSRALKEHSRLVEETLAWITQGGLQHLAMQTCNQAASAAVPTTPATTLRIKMSL